VPETAPADAFERNVREAGVVFDGPTHRVLESPGFVHARPDPVNQQPLRPQNRDQGNRRSNEKVFDKSIHHYGGGAEAHRNWTRLTTLHIVGKQGPGLTGPDAISVEPALLCESDRSVDLFDGRSGADGGGPAGQLAAGTAGSEGPSDGRAQVGMILKE